MPSRGGFCSRELGIAESATRARIACEGGETLSSTATLHGGEVTTPSVMLADYSFLSSLRMVISIARKSH